MDYNIKLQLEVILKRNDNYAFCIKNNVVHSAHFALFSTLDDKKFDD